VSDANYTAEPSEESKDINGSQTTGRNDFYKRLHDYHLKITESRNAAIKKVEEDKQKVLFHSKTLTIEEKRKMADRSCFFIIIFFY